MNQNNNYPTITKVKQNAYPIMRCVFLIWTFAVSNQPFSALLINNLSTWNRQNIFYHSSKCQFSSTCSSPVPASIVYLQFIGAFDNLVQVTSSVEESEEMDSDSDMILDD